MDKKSLHRTAGAGLSEQWRLQRCFTKNGKVKWSVSNPEMPKISQNGLTMDTIFTYFHLPRFRISSNREILNLAVSVAAYDLELAEVKSVAAAGAQGQPG